MLGRLLTSAALSRAGYGMVRKGLAMRREQKTAHVRGLVSSVHARTRGSLGTNNPALFSKNTLIGSKRRLDAATKIRSLRNGSKPAVAGITPSPQKINQVKRIRSITRIGFKGTGQSLSKKTRSGILNRGLLATDIRAARKGPHTSTFFGHKTPGVYSPRTADFRRRKKP